MSIGTVHALEPVGVAVTPLPLATASWVLVEARPDSDEVALVGHGFVADAVERQAPVPDASAIGALLASASEPPPANCKCVEEVERHESSVGLDAPLVGLRAARSRTRRTAPSWPPAPPRRS